ncbi:MAG: DNA polymerase III subunit [Aerococcaceae bacterium]|nr:DNA polymerase III subunit [Aerococcaceae bacterium]
MVLQEQFYRAIHEGKLAHAYLFVGDDVAHKKQLTQSIVQGLACAHTEQGKACQQCAMCERILQGQFADFCVVTPETNTLKVEQIRELKEWLLSSPMEEDFKVAVIERAEWMTPSAANALLTFLEEPVNNVYVILYANDTTAMLPTILSRVQQFHFKMGGVKIRQQQWEAQGVQSEHAQLLACLTAEIAESFVANYDSQDFSQWQKGLQHVFRLLVKQDSMAFVAVQTHLKTTLSIQHVLAALDYYSVLTHQLMHLVQSASFEPILHSYWLTELCAEARPTLAQLLKLHQALLGAKRDLLANVSGQLILEKLAIVLSKW